MSIHLNTTESEPHTVLGTHPLPWFAIRVKSNCERAVSTTLRGKGLEDFVPMYRVKRQWSDRIKIIDFPLFPGYVFCRLDLDRRLPLLTTPGFLYLVGKGKNPEPVEEQEILAIRSVVRSGVAAVPWPTLAVGQKIRLKRGPLRGVEGVVAKIGDRDRIHINATLLQRSVAVQVEPEWICAADDLGSILTA